MKLLLSSFSSYSGFLFLSSYIWKISCELLVFFFPCSHLGEGSPPTFCVPLSFCLSLLESCPSPGHLHSSSSCSFS
ncbi:hypothetical protein CSUI_008628, partial [Cystoisospora suis]